MIMGTRAGAANLVKSDVAAARSLLLRAGVPEFLRSLLELLDGRITLQVSPGRQSQQRSEVEE